MGQEWAASTPFQFFTDFPEELGRLVTEGRRNEFKAFAAFADPVSRERIPDPQAKDTFVRSKLRWEERSDPPHRGMLALYSELLAMRRSHPALRSQDRKHFTVTALGDHALALRRSSPDGEAILVVVNFAGELRFRAEDRPGPVHLRAALATSPHDGSRAIWRGAVTRCDWTRRGSSRFRHRRRSSFDHEFSRYGSLHFVPSRAMNSSATVGPHVPAA